MFIEINCSINVEFIVLYSCDIVPLAFANMLYLLL